MKRKLVIITIIFTCFLLICILGEVSLQIVDPDFGWHLTVGRLIVAKGIPKTDPFSYTMPSYPFVDHEWLTNVGIAYLYPRIGFIGLSILFTLLAYFSLLLQLPLLLKKWTPIPFILGISALVTYMGIRPQIISWVLFSFLLVILLQEKLWKKLRFFLPLLFLIWVNLHGGFALGIVALGIALVIKVWGTKKIQIGDWIIFALCIAATFCNPYTYRIWWEVWVSLSDTSLHWSILEWFPTLFMFNFGLIALLPLSAILVFLNRKQFSVVELVLYVALLVFGLSSSRNAPFWIILALPITVRAIVYFYEQTKAIPGATARFNKAYIFYLIFVMVGSSWQVLSPLLAYKINTNASFYPQQAMVYLQKHPSSGQMFSEYDWGGYLIWKLPEKKVFIDGRMPSWRREATNSYESKYAFRDYQDIFTGKLSFASIVKKYNIDTVLVRSARITNKPTQLEILEKIFVINPPNLDFQTLMREVKMEIVYKDRTSVIYRKK